MAGSTKTRAKAREAGRSAWRATARQPARAAILVLGLAAVITALVVWLVPTSSGTTTTRERSTTAVTNAAGGKDTTAVDKTTVTRAPGASRSDTVVVALLTLGGGLLLAASFWSRIHSLTIGGVAVTLEEATVSSGTIGYVETAAGHVETSTRTSTAVDELVPQVDSVAKRDRRLVCVNLGADDVWGPLNLKLFVLLLAHRTNTEVIVFIRQEVGAEEKTYYGSASAALLGDKLAADDPDLAAAHRATEGIPLDRSELKAGQATIGRTFFDELGKRDQSRAEGAQAPTERVDLSSLEEIAGPLLITDSVPSEGGRALSSRQQRDVLMFPLPYVPITDRGTLEELIDQSRLAKQIALSAVGGVSRA